MFKALFANIPDVVKNLLIINVIIFLASQAFPQLYQYLSLFYFDSPFFGPQGIVTHMFMHGGWGHLFFNMFALWMFGSPLERLWGPKKFLFFYLFTGLGAAALHMGVMAFEVHQIMGSIAPGWDQVVGTKAMDIYRIPTVGASGAVFGLLLGFGMYFPNTEIMLIFLPIPIKAKYFVILYGAFELYSGIMRNPGDNVAHFAHLGGLLFGFILIKFWRSDIKRYN